MADDKNKKPNPFAKKDAAVAEKPVEDKAKKPNPFAKGDAAPKDDKAAPADEKGKAPSFLEKVKDKGAGAGKPNPFAKGGDAAKKPDTGAIAAKNKPPVEKGEKDQVRFNPTIPDEEATNQNIKKIAEELGDEANELMEEWNAISEDLSLSGRMQRRAVFRRLKSKLEIKRQRAVSKRASSEVIHNRARRMTINKFKSQFSQGRPLNDLSISDKERLERLVKARKKLIDRKTKRNVRVVKAIERARLNGHKYTGGN
ncbi:hypothetical protein EVB91_081 [Rhizobium phage RHph_I1_18]|nr:hypothetical protein EVB91_081 [Rhizobium phage RHph_I1_18]